MEEKQFNFDLIKGFLCICVVIGHCTKTVPNGIIQIIYWFHMPCFFVLSGWFLKAPENIFSWIKNKVIRIWIPQIVWFFLLFFINGRLCIKNILHFICGARNLGGVWWYVPTLFLSMLMFIIMEKYFSKYYMAVLAVIYLFVCADYYFFIPKLDRNKLPFSIGVAMLAFIYVSMGHYLKAYWTEMNTAIFVGRLLKKSRRMFEYERVKLSVICIVTFIVLYKMGIYKYHMNMAGMKLGAVLWNLIIPFSAMTILLYISTQIKELCGLLNKIEIFGKNSLMIMYLHKFVLNDIIEPVLGVEGYVWIINVLLTLLICYVTCILISRNAILCKCLGGRSIS